MDTNRNQVRRTGRAAAYCMNEACSHFGRGWLLARDSVRAACKRCHLPARVERERGWRNGPTGVVGEVRIEFRFNALTGRYGSLSVVRDERILRPECVYVVQSPVVHTESEARTLGRVLLAALNRPLDEPQIPNGLASREDLLREGWSPLA